MSIMYVLQVKLQKLDLNGTAQKDMSRANG